MPNSHLSPAPVGGAKGKGWGSNLAGPDNRMTGAENRMVQPDAPDEAERVAISFFELNSRLSEAKTLKEREELRERLRVVRDRYQAYPDEIHKIMAEIVAPFLSERLKSSRAQGALALEGSKELGTELTVRRTGFWDIEILAPVLVDTVFLEESSGAGAGSYASHHSELVRTGQQVRVIAYDAYNGELVPGRTFNESHGVAEPVDFGIDDLILWPKLIFDLARIGIRVVTKVTRFGARLTFTAGKVAVRGAKGLGLAVSKRLAARELKALEKIEKELAELVNKTVRLGARLGAHDGANFAGISALEACKDLFSKKLRDIPRLAQHWPDKLAGKYIAEVKQLILDGVMRTKIAKEVATELATNGLSKDLLGKLPGRLQSKVKKLVENRWDYIRTKFWENVFDDRGLVAELENIGLRAEGRGKSPILRIGGKDLKITLDHVARKVENPLEAFSAENLRALTSRDNSVIKEALARDIKKLTGLTVDEFEALGKEAERVPRDMAKALGEAIDASPTDAKLFRGLGWPEKPDSIPSAKVVRPSKK